MSSMTAEIDWSSLEEVPTGTHAAYTNYPVGTQVGVPFGMAYSPQWAVYRKDAPDHWTRTSGPAYASPERTDYGMSTYYMVRLLPSAVPAVGTPITSREQLDALPAGSVLRAGGPLGYLIVKRENGEWWGDQDGFNYTTMLDLTGWNAVESVGPASVTEVEPVEPVPWDEIDLEQMWSDFRRAGHRLRHRDAFLHLLRESTTEPEYVDEVGFCANCYQPGMDVDFNTTGDSDEVCDTCWENYWACADCEERFSNLRSTLDDDEVCQGCLERSYSYCDDCGGYYHGDYSGDHRHDGSGCCESPAVGFSIRNDGLEPLPNDTRVRVSLPAGIISEEGLDGIYGLIRNDAYRRWCSATPDTKEELSEAYTKACELSYRLPELGAQWQTKQGNYTKRLSRFAYNEFKIKLSPEVISQVGCIASDHSTAVDFEVEVTRMLNLPAEEFAHEGSCWWNSYSESRCALKTNGGFGLRSFDDGQVTGRAWVMPLKQTEEDEVGYHGLVTKPAGSLVPTFETLTPAAFVVFNGYGDLSGYAAVRIMSHLAGWTYRKIDFSCSPMYVNGESGYLVGPEEIVSNYTDGSLSFDVEEHANLHDTEKKG